MLPRRSTVGMLPSSRIKCDFFSAICLFCRKANVAYFYSLGRQRQTNADSSSPWIAYSGTIYWGLSQLLPYTKPMFPSKGKRGVAICVSCQDAAGCGVQCCWKFPCFTVWVLCLLPSYEVHERFYTEQRWSQ